MGSVILRPNGTSANSGDVTGASAHAALSDDSDATFVDYNAGESTTLALGNSSIPASAAIVRAILQVRCKRIPDVYGFPVPALTSELASGGDSQAAAVGLSNTVPAVALANVWDIGALGFVDADVDALTAAVGCISSGALLRVYEVSALIQYVTQPAVAITAPTGTISTNLVEAAWSATLDTLGGSASAARVVVMASGDDPDIDDPILDSGVFDGAVGDLDSFEFKETVPNGNYDTYVQVAQTVNGELFWSDWDSQAFTVNAPKPGVPTLTLTPEPDEGRIKIELNDSAGAAATVGYELERRFNDGTSQALRTPLDGLQGSDVTAYDVEAPNGEEVTYAARALSAAGVATDWVEESATWSSSRWYLRDPFDPALGVSLAMASYPGQSRALQKTAHRVLNRPDPVVIKEGVALPTGTLQVRCDTVEDRRALDALIVEGNALLLLGPVAERDADRWIEFMDTHERERLADKSFIPETWESFSWVEVARPTGDLTAWPD